ncbi:unnamed protein product [Moneuplotes crassus]|uniref:Uncharacterized protein n=1 Tax=Euplotes crassus TaxID=5936 RepID=A0AAD1Y3E9_EUPCR|nr:unnamed protein product [Moneuplotes crassus]
MTTWVTNFIFKKAAIGLKAKQHFTISRYLGVKGAQKHLLNDIESKEYKQLFSYANLHDDHVADDILVKAEARARGNYQKGDIDLADYLRITEKIKDLKKQRFAENYDGEKVSTIVGGTRQREFNNLLNQLDKNERGEIAHKLWRTRKEADPAARGPIGYR